MVVEKDLVMLLEELELELLVLFGALVYMMKICLSGTEMM